MRLTRWLIAAATIFGVAGIAFALSFLSTVYDTPAGVEPAKVTDWMQAWGSIAAFAAGLLAAIFTAALLLHEMRQAAEARADASAARQEAAEDRAQLALQRAEDERRLATLIIVDQPSVSVVHPDEINDKRFVYLTLITASIHNAGNVPVRDLICEFWIRGDAEPVFRKIYGMLIADRDRPEPNNDDRLGMPTYRHLRAVASFDPARATTPAILQRDSLLIVLTFTDVNGRRWRRVDNGTPTRVDSDAAHVTPLKVSREKLTYHREATKDLIAKVNEANPVAASD